MISPLVFDSIALIASLVLAWIAHEFGHYMIARFYDRQARFEWSLRDPGVLYNKYYLTQTEHHLVLMTGILAGMLVYIPFLWYSPGLGMGVVFSLFLYAWSCKHDVQELLRGAV